MILTAEERALIVAALREKGAKHGRRPGAFLDLIEMAAERDCLNLAVKVEDWPEEKP